MSEYVTYRRTTSILQIAMYTQTDIVHLRERYTVCIPPRMKKSPTAAVAARNVQSIFCIAAPKEVTANGGASELIGACAMIPLGLLHPAHAPSTYCVHSLDTGDQKRSRT